MKHVVALLAIVCLSAFDAKAQDLDVDENLAWFETRIRPVLTTRCVKCHGPAKQEGSLRLDSRAAILKGGDSGPAITPEHPQQSLLLSAIRYDDLEMPPEKPLDPEVVAHFETWIEHGVFWPEHAATIRSATAEITAQERQWWAFQPLQHVTPPPSTFKQPDSNEIDRFVHRRLAENSMRPAAEASKVTLVRRLYQTVIGLPPTPEEIKSFVQDDSEDAYERLVDALLADQRYGEHWARFWLDLVRYAESDGWKADAYRPNSWRYRDYVVGAFNNDKPYTEFVQEQLAGDELENPSPEALAATGYLRLGIFEYNQRNARQHWDDILNEITDVTGDVFLGLGLACARCHDHKFDPLLQVDYYKLRAFFEPIVFRDDVPYATAEEVAEFDSKERQWNRLTSDLRQEIATLTAPYFANKRKATIDKFPLEIQASYFKPSKEKNSWDQQMTYFVTRQFSEEGTSPLQKIKGRQKERYDALQHKLAKHDSVRPSPLPKLLSARNHDGEFADTFVPGRPEEPIEAGFIRVLSQTCGPEYPDCDRRRRTRLAHWITSPSNPLTTRVLVNRIWKQHFGRGIVQTTSDFGTLGGTPTHPHLLDWLTSQFIEDGWRLKSLQKRILLSATWKQASGHTCNEAYAERDPQIKLLWRRKVQRLTAEQIRDAMLVANRTLVGKLGGPSVLGKAPRRSLYVKSYRNTPDRFLHAFDVANGLKSVAQRTSTTTPMQALMMINGEFTLEQARKMALHLGAISDDESRVRTAILATWGRDPTPDELREGSAFLASESTESAFEATVDFCHVLLNSSEFLYVD